MAELIDLTEVDEQQALVLILNQLQLISIQLYRLYDVIAVTALQNTPSGTERRYDGVLEVQNPELKSLLDYHEAGNMPYAAKIDLLGDDNGSQKEGEDEFTSDRSEQSTSPE